VTDVLRK